ncbi:MAG: hypothetical protein KDE56_24800, partial [Anaerolineales bacterium]|nr:hypothetical protein [Anaerolineales bacterium]
MTESLPHWDLSDIYPGLDTPEFAEGFANGLQTIKELVALFDQHQINRIDNANQIPENPTAVLDQILTAYNSGVDEIITLYTYIYSFIATDSRDTAAQAKLSEIQQQFSHLSLLGTRLTAWLGSLDVEQLIARSPIAADHAFALRRAQREAEHLMSPIEEALAAELNLTGSQSWNRLFSTYTSQLTVTVEMEGESKEMALTAAQNLMFSPD